MRTIAYLRISKDSQDLNNQRYTILDYAHKHDIKINEFIEITISSRKSPEERGIDDLLNRLGPEDCLIVSELSRLGRSVGQVITIVDALIKRSTSFIAIKESIVLNGYKQDIQAKVTITLFGLFAEIERDLISERTKAGLAAAREKGKLIGRPKGTFKSRLDGRENEIKLYLGKKVSKASIAKILEVSETTLHSFIKSRHIR